MAGRKPKPTALKKLEGNPEKRKLNTKEPMPGKGMPDCLRAKRIVNYGNSGYYQVLSAEVGGKHGFSVSGLVFDEIHTQPNRQLYDVLTKGSSDARQNPLHFIITTAGTDRHSIAYELHTKAVDILEGRRVDPTFYTVVYACSVDQSRKMVITPALANELSIWHFPGQEDANGE